MGMCYQDTTAKTKHHSGTERYDHSDLNRAVNDTERAQAELFTMEDHDSIEDMIKDNTLSEPAEQSQ